MQIARPTWSVKGSMPALESRASTATENCTLLPDNSTQSTDPCCWNLADVGTKVPDIATSNFVLCLTFRLVDWVSLLRGELVEH